MTRWSLRFGKKEMIQYINALEHILKKRIDIVVLLQPTAPLRSKEDKSGLKYKEGPSAFTD